MKYIVAKNDVELTIKEILKTRIGISSRLYTRLKKNKKIKINGENRLLHELLNEGDVVEISFDYEKNTFESEYRQLDILYEDDVLIIVNKDPYYVVHPTKGHPVGTLMNFVAYHLNENGDNSKIRFVNRLDRDTSGVVIMAKNQFIHHRISEAMKNNNVEKFYIALVKGIVKDDWQLIDLPIERESEDSVKRIVREDGKVSKTEIEVIERLDKHTLLKIKLHTGRTHQIRVHLNYIGHPVVGDELYGGKSDLMDRQFLHCIQMRFIHPITAEKVVVDAEYKDDMKCTLEQIRSK